MKLTSPVFFPCKKPCYYANLAYRRQKVNLLLIVPRYKANQSVMSNVDDFTGRFTGNSCKLKSLYKQSDYS